MQNQEQTILFICSDLCLLKSFLVDLLSPMANINPSLLSSLNTISNNSSFSYLSLSTKYYSTKITLAFLEPTTIQHATAFIIDNHLDVQIILQIQQSSSTDNDVFVQLCDKYMPQSQALVEIKDSIGEWNQVEIKGQMVEVVDYVMDQKAEVGLLQQESGQQRLIDMIECTSWINIDIQQDKKSGFKSKAIEIEKDSQIVDELMKEKKGIDNEDNMEEFSRMMGQMANLKASSQGLSDKERREQASDLILKLSQMMGGIDSDDDHDGDQM